MQFGSFLRPGESAAGALQVGGGECEFIQQKK